MIGAGPVLAALALFGALASLPRHAAPALLATVALAGLGWMAGNALGFGPGWLAAMALAAGAAVLAGAVQGLRRLAGRWIPPGWGYPLLVAGAALAAGWTLWGA